MPRTEPVWRRLADGLTGRVVRPGTPDYDRVRRPWAARFADATPEAIVLCADADDVARTLLAANDLGLPTVVRSGGHDFAGRSSTSGVVIDLGGLDQIGIRGTAATVGAGARLGAVYAALHPVGRALPAGCGPTVGIAGLTLGGGLGILGRRHGLTCDSLVRAEVVLADGRVVRCDDQEHPDLFWALRGAGHGYLGIVTELVFATVPTRPCTVFSLDWAFADAVAVLSGWQATAPDSPDDLAASLLVEVPADPRQAPRVTVAGALVDRDADAARMLLGELVRTVGVPPTSEWFAERPLPAAKTLLAERAPGPGDGPAHSKSAFFARPLPAATVTDLVEALVADRVPGEARELDLSPWGGAYNAPAPDATAFVHRDARFLLKQTATLVPAGEEPAAAQPSDWLGRSWRLTKPYDTGGVYPNFPDPDLPDPATAYFGANLPRLRAVKADYDPDRALPPLPDR